MDSTLADFVDEAVAQRFLAIRGRLREREGDYIYNGPRTQPENLGWRFRQNLAMELREAAVCGWQGYSELPAEIGAGKHDGMIEHTWGDAASAEHWYRYEKDYGSPDDPEFEYP